MSAVTEPPTAATEPAPPAAPRGFRRIPGLAWLCALAALLNAVAWGLIIPPFHVPDENAHVAYVQYLDETGKAPKHAYKGGFSDEENRALDAMAFYSVIGNPVQRVPSDARERAKIAADERGPVSKVGASDAGSATNNPPLYYAVEAVPYELSPTGTFLLDRLVWMRIFSALMAAGTVLCVFLLCRELFPGTPWAWPFGALAAAFQPEFGFISGGVQVDNGLILCSAAFFLAVAWTLRRGLTARRGVAVGLTLAAGLLVKTTMVAFVPAAVVALLIAAWRVRGDRRASLGGIAGAALACAVPLALYVLLSVAVWDRPIAAAAQTIANAGTHQHATPSLRENLVYAWELFLPRLPFMSHQFGGSFPLWDLWFTGLVGRFGWVDYAFPEWVSWVALPFVVVVVALAISGLVRLRAVLGGRWLELGVYALAALGLAGVIAFAGYRYRLENGPDARFEQARYLLPLLPLWGALVVLAVRSAGRRWGAALGGLVVMASVVLTVFGQLLTIDRYYS